VHLSLKNKIRWINGKVQVGQNVVTLGDRRENQLGSAILYISIRRNRRS
jgi:hypothetical protein